MNDIRIVPDEHLIVAGECFMYLCWVETTMRDFVVLHHGSKDMRDRYSKAFGQGNHPSDFARERLKHGTLTFNKIKELFLCVWPKWKTQNNIHEAIERAVIWRNAFGHAQVQQSRPYLLYTPNRQSWKKINEYTRCDKCSEFHRNCRCPKENVADPHTIIMRCNDESFLKNLYGDIQTIDMDCFLHTAEMLSIPYDGIAWPGGDQYVISRYRPDEET